MTEKLTEFLSSPVPWTSGHDLNAVVVATRLRLARNLSGFVFPTKASPVSSSNVEELLRNRITCLDKVKFTEYFRFEELPMEISSVIQSRKLGGRGFAFGKRPRAIAANQDRCFHAVVNADDHLRLYHTMPGMDFRKSWEALDEVDDELAAMLDFAFDEQLGYLTASPKNIGTGLRVSALLHLPALNVVGHLPRATRALAETGHQLVPFLSRGITEMATGSLFTIYNLSSLGLTEAECVSELETIVPLVVGYEEKARKAVGKVSWKMYVSDLVNRALGTVRSADLIEFEEMMSLLSRLRLGAQLGRVPERIGTAMFELMFDLQSQAIRLREGAELDEITVSNLRAVALRKWFEDNAN